MIDETLITRFAARFDGYDRAHGRYEIKRKAESGKMEGRANTIHEGATSKHFSDHLNGTGPGLGIIALRADNTCAFAAIDIDINNIDHAALCENVKKFALPLVVCRSKSGGAHLYLFCDPPAPAVVVREKLTEWSARLGYGGCEVFPKQVSRGGPTDIGNWINLPFYGAEETQRYAFRDGERIGLAEFLDIADATAITPDQLEEAGDDEHGAELFKEAPPCLQHLFNQGGFGQGQRNEGMFNVGVYLTKRFPDDWEEKMMVYNMEVCQPPIGPQELVDIIKSARRKDYGYRCNQPPIKNHCQRRKCQRAMFGIGQSPETLGLEIGAITKYEASSDDPVMWGLEINGVRFLIDTETLFDKNALNKVCMQRIHSIPIQLTPARWHRMLNDLLKNADVVPVPADAGRSGILWEWVEQFLTQKAVARQRDEIFTGRPYFEDGKVHFRSMDLFQYLDARRVPYESPQKVWHLLKDRGAEKDFWNVGGKGVNVWILPEPDRATMGAPTPVQLGEEEF